MTALSPPGSTLQRSDRMDRALQAEKLQLRLLMVEEKYRGHVMTQQVEAFEDKVYISFQNFNIDLLVTMVNNLRNRCKPPRVITSLAALHRAVVEEASRNTASRRIHESRDRQNLPMEEDSCVKYFLWLFEYLDYLRDLKVNFTERIFQPLFRYFYEGPSGKDEYRRGSSSTFSFSKFSQFSSDSDSGDVDDIDDDVTTARQRAQAKAALMLLSNEFTDIKTLYDTTEIDNVAQRLSRIKEQLDFLLDNEDVINSELFSYESERVMFHLDTDDATETLGRFIPDILIKFQKSAWLVRKWLKFDSLRIKDLDKKLETILELERKLNRRMSVLASDIDHNQDELEQEMAELEKLLLREERSNDLNVNLFDCDDKIDRLQDRLEGLRKARDQLTLEVMGAIRSRNRRQYDDAKVRYESNKLQRYLVERQLGTLRFHRDVTEQDMRVELSLKPSLIHHTNSLQDRCEQLEQTISRDRNQKHTIKTALIPIAEDRKVVSERLLQKRRSEPQTVFPVAQYLGSTRHHKQGGEALFVKSHIPVPTRATHLRTYRRPKTPEW